MTDTDVLLTTTEVAELLRVHRVAVWNWRKGGHLPGAVNIAPPESKRPVYRWRKSALMQFLGEQS